jgi:hypothetical protein
MDAVTSDDFCNRIPSDAIPVLLILFNRPDMVKPVIENLRQVRPKRLFLAADGPRVGHPQDADKCRLAREAALSVDWDCHIETRFHETNLGCDPAVSSAIDWFFQQVECGILLEDDCLVHPDYFALCGELLERYREDERIMQIASFSPYPKREHSYDYHFSRRFRCSGGWATWRRAWIKFRSDMHQYQDRESWQILNAYHRDYLMLNRSYRSLIACRNGKRTHWDHWDFQWNLSCNAQNGLSLVPEPNLMLNIGFGEDSTHTKEIDPIFHGLAFESLSFPLRHPPLVYADQEPEQGLEKRLYHALPLAGRCKWLLRHVLGAWMHFREMLPW